MPVFDPLITVNGQLGGGISPLDRGFAYGDGVFETLRVSPRGIALWDFHLQRLVSSCERLAIPLDVASLTNHRDEMLQLARWRGIGVAVMKIIVTRGEGGRGYAAPEQTKPTLCVGLFPLPEYPPEYQSQGVTVVVCQQRLSECAELAGIKHLNKLEHVLARREWQGNAFAEGLLCDQAGRVIEGTVTNVFVVKGERLCTPRLERCGVAGVMRRLVLEKFAPQLNLPAEEIELTLEDLWRAQEIFLSNSVNGLWPVALIQEKTALAREMEKTALAREKKVVAPGKVTQRVQQSLNRYLIEWENRPA